MDKVNKLFKIQGPFTIGLDGVIKNVFRKYNHCN